MNMQKGIITLMMLVGLAYFLLPMAGMSQGKQDSKQIVTVVENLKQNSELNFENPLKGTYHVSFKYGKRKDPMHEDRMYFHYGIDLAAKMKTPVYAAESGYVDMPKTKRSYGKNILIDHGQKFKTCYAHLDSVMVQSGSLVKKGDLIGLVGNSGKSTGPHLHLEVIKDGERVDPEQYITF